MSMVFLIYVISQSFQEFIEKTISIVYDKLNLECIYFIFFLFLLEDFHHLKYKVNPYFKGYLLQVHLLLEQANEFSCFLQDILLYLLLHLSLLMLNIQDKLGTYNPLAFPIQYFLMSKGINLIQNFSMKSSCLKSLQLFQNSMLDSLKYNSFLLTNCN